MTQDQLINIATELYNASTELQIIAHRAEPNHAAVHRLLDSIRKCEATIRRAFGFEG